MKVWEALDLYASFYPKSVDWNELLVQLGLEEKRMSFFRKLSGGQKQRLFIALALLPDPQLVFLYELTTGLDLQARHVIWDLVRDIRTKGKTVLLTTHFMEEAEKLYDRVAILDHGKIVALDTPANLIRSLGVAERVSFSFFGIGFILAGTMPSARTAQIVGLVLLYPMVFLSGASFPRELLPEAINRVSTFLPLTYVVNLLRGLWIGETWSQHITDVIVLVGILVAGVLISIKTFRWE
jgi:hypothetical protein